MTPTWWASKFVGLTVERGIYVFHFLAGPVRLIGACAAITVDHEDCTGWQTELQ